MTDIFFKTLRTSHNLHTAWRHVRKSALQSSNPDIRNAAQEFEIKSHSFLKSIQGKLGSKTYKFPAAEGILKDKKKRKKLGKPPRPIVINTLEGRIVQRAILQTLQPDRETDLYNRIGSIKDVNESPYGVGGLPYPYGGVSVGIKSVLEAMDNGYEYFFKSDIKEFFTRIPHESVVKFIHEQTKDYEISQIFSLGLNVELSNKEKLAEYFELFPQKGVGVPQGSSLSAFAGNILLYDLDFSLNTSDTKAYRYIDDLIILGKTNEAVQKARSESKKWLKKKGMTLYEPTKGSDKAEEGNVSKGFIYLGCKIFPKHIEPSVTSKQNLLRKIKKEISNGKKYISSLCEDPDLTRRTQSAYLQVLSRIDRVIYGWGQSFSFCNNRLPFKNLDQETSNIINEFNNWYKIKTISLTSEQKRRALGVTLLQDIESTYDDEICSEKKKKAA